MLDVSGASSGQIQFPATQNPSTNVNTLDDYEEGSWTPTISFSTSNGDLSYSVQVGRYVKIGKTVTIECNIQFSETTASGGITIGGLPFTTANVTNLIPQFPVGVENMTLIVGAPVGQINVNMTTMSMRYTGTGTQSLIDNTNTGANSAFRFGFTYIAEQ